MRGNILVSTPEDSNVLHYPEVRNPCQILGDSGLTTDPMAIGFLSRDESLLEVCRKDVGRIPLTLADFKVVNFRAVARDARLKRRDRHEMAALSGCFEPG